jgi:hypothetical protein
MCGTKLANEVWWNTRDDDSRSWPALKNFILLYFMRRRHITIGIMTSYT